MKRVLKILPWAFLALFASEIIAVMWPKKDGVYHVREFARLPVLLNGRIQPFDSVARNSLLQMRSTGDLPLEIVPGWKFWHHPKKLKATEWLLELMTRPEVADTRSVFLIHHAELLGELKLQDKGLENSGLRYYSFDELRPRVSEVLEQAGRIIQREENKTTTADQRTTYEKQLMKLFNAVTLYQRLKNTLEPEGIDDFAQVLVDFEKDIVPGRVAAKAAETGQPYDTNAVQKLAEPIELFQHMARLQHVLNIPPLEPNRARDNWQGAGAALMDGARTDHFHPAVVAYATMATAYRDKEPEAFNHAIAQYKAWLTPNFHKELKKGRAEFFYNDTNAFLHATIMYIFVLVLAGAALLTLSMTPNFGESLRLSAWNVVLLAGLVHTFGLVFRMVLEGRPPVTNLYSSAIFIGWGAMLLGIALERIYKMCIGLIVAALAGFTTLLIAHNLALGGDTMEMLRAVLDTNFWLATHVVVVTLGYASTFVAGLLAIIYIVLGVFTPRLKEKLGGFAAAGARQVSAKAGQIELGKALSKMVYGIVCFATLFSFVGTVLGGIWADQSWGRFWGWDPKENGALLIVLWNAMFLHARWGGIARERGLMNMAVFGNIVTSFSWFGVNMLGIGLHSYGFMDAAFKWLMMFVGSQVAIIGLGMLPLRMWRSFRQAVPEEPPPDVSPKSKPHPRQAPAAA
jgi:cytochrome c-type biogenesis protein CcsB